MVEKSNNGNPVPAESIPLIFKLKSGQFLGKEVSNQEGKASLYFPAMKLPDGKNEIEVIIDLEKYADLDTSSSFYAKVINNNPVLPAKFEVELIPLIYFVESNEIVDNKSVEVNIIDPALKNLLAEQGYQFVSQAADADFVIQVNAVTTAGNTYNGIYFSYVDATMSIIDAVTGLEKYKTSVEQVKGGGSNSQKAGMKALKLASEQLKEELLNFLND